MAKQTDTKGAGGAAKPPAKAAGEKKGKPEQKGGRAGADITISAERPHSSSGGKARLREHYLKSVVPALTKDFSYKNPMAVPKVQKISINIGLGEATGNSKLMDGAVAELAAIAGQKPVVTKAKNRLRRLSCAKACRSVAW